MLFHRDTISYCRLLRIGLSQGKVRFTDYYQSHAIEPRTDVGEAPEKDAEFQRINEIFDEEEPAKLADRCISVCNGYVRDFVHLLRGYCQVQVQDVPEIGRNRLLRFALGIPKVKGTANFSLKVLLEGVPIGSLMDSLEDGLVDPEGNGTGED